MIRKASLGTQGSQHLNSDKGREDESEAGRGFFARIVSPGSSPSRRFAVSILVLFLAVLLQFLFRDITALATFIFLYPAVFLVAWLSGFGAALAGIVVSAIVVAITTLWPIDHDDLARIVIFATVATVVSWIVAFGRKLEQDRELSHRKSRENELRLNAILQSLPLGLIIIDRQNRVITTNHRVETTYAGATKLDRSVEQFRADKVFWPGTEKSISKEEWPSQIAMANNVVVPPVEMEVVRSDGTRAIISDSAAPIHGENGQVSGAVVVVQDITSQKQAERALYESEEMLRAIFNGAYDGVLLHSPEGAILEANARFLAMYGLTHEEATKVSISDLTGAASPVHELPGMWERVLNGESLLFEWRARRPKDNHEFDVEVFLRCIRLRGKDRILANIRDITERKRTEAQLQAAIRARDNFLSIASHELTTPLTSVQLQVQTLERSIRTADKSPVSMERIQRASEVIAKQIRRLTALVHDLLDVSRISAGKLTLSKETMNLSSLLEEVIERNKEQLDKAHMTINKVIEPGVSASCDPLRFEQVITNLISNAIKYAPGTPLSIALRATGPLVRLEISDRGPGIAPENQEKIFNRFERGVADSTAISGLGLGLYISRQIIRAHGGRIWVESELGKGSRFVVEIPTGT